LHQDPTTDEKGVRSGSRPWPALGSRVRSIAAEVKGTMIRSQMWFVVCTGAVWIVAGETVRTLLPSPPRFCAR
jgi:hypothetical protein